METDAIRVGVVMQRLPLNNRWQPFQWRPMEIVSEDVFPEVAGAGSVRCLRSDPDDSRWLFGGFEVRLYSDEGEGYFLNINAESPSWFIMWRFEEIDGVEIAVPKSVTLSYNQAARLMDGGEQVDRIDLPQLIIDRLAEFTADEYRPEVKKKRRKPSFEGGAAVQQMARDEGKIHGGK